MPTAYSYIRISRAQQARGDGIRRQMAEAKEWAAANGMVIDQSLRDIGVSAFRGKNKVEGPLAAFLELVKDGEIERGSYLLIESLDRLSREAVIDALPDFIKIMQAGIFIVTLIDKKVFSADALRKDWTPLIVSLAQMARAHEESVTKLHRTTKAWDQKRLNADKKVMTARVPGWLQVVNGKIIENTHRANVVRDIFRWTLEGDGRRIIVARLNEELKEKSFKNDRPDWHLSYVAKLLRNRSVMGEFQPYKLDERGIRQPYGSPIAGYYPVTISEADFLRAGRTLDDRRNAPGRRGEGIPNLFIGLAKCDHCGSSMGLENKGAPPKGARYFVCSNARRRAGCNNSRRWRLDRVEEAVLARLWHADLERVLPKVVSSTVDLEREKLVNRIETDKLASTRIMKLVEEGYEMMEQRFRDLAASIKASEGELATLRKNKVLDAVTPPIQARIGLILEIRKAMAISEGEERARLRRKISDMLRLNLDRIRFEPERVITRYKDARAKHHPIRVPAPGRPLPPLEIVAIDETADRYREAPYDLYDNQ